MPEQKAPEEKEPSSSSRSRRGSRGGRGRRSKTSADAVEQQAPATNGPALDVEPRVVRRRPAANKAAEPQPADATAADPPADEVKPKRRTRSRGSTSVATETPAEQPAETSGQKRATASRRAGAAKAAEPEPAASPAAEEEKPKPRRTRRATAKPAEAADGAPAELAALSAAVMEVRQAVDALGERMERATKRARLGVFVDVPNVLYGAERLESLLDMGKLLHYLSDGRELVRATAYSPVSDDPSEPVERQRFVAPFVPHEYRIVTKPLKRFADGSIKGNFDVEMAIDMLTMAERLEVIAIVSGDSDFARLVEVIQGRGVRVEVVAFAGSTSAEMRALADRYVELGAITDQIIRA